MPKFKVAVQWTEIGEFEVEANSLDEAIAKVEENENDEYPTSKAGGEYVDDSFEVNMDVTQELNSTGRCKHCNNPLYGDGVDQTGGDVCGYDGGNELHEVE